jgi:HEAT repeat protein
LFKSPVLDYFDINSFPGLTKMEFIKINWFSSAIWTDNVIAIISAIYGAISFFRTIFIWLTEKLTHRRLKKYVEKGELIDYLNSKYPSGKRFPTRQKKRISRCLAKILLDQKKNWESRRDAAAGLGEIQSGLRELAEALHSDPEIKVRCTAAESLGKIKDKAAVPHLLLHCSEFSPITLLESVVIALGSIPADKAEKQLIKLLQHDKYTVQYEVTKAIGNIKEKDTECFNRLTHLLKKNKNRANADPSPWTNLIESSTAEAIATFGTLQADKVLTVYRNDNPMSPENLKTIYEKYFKPTEIRRI